MTAGMAHVSGGIMAAYIGYGIKAEHLLAAVIMTAPGTILMAKMLVPETEQPKTAGTVEISKEEMHKDANILGAIARGTIDGGQLAFNVAIMLISFLALIAMLNGIMGWTHNHFAWFPGKHSTGSRRNFFARRLAHRCARERLRRCRQSARHTHGDQ